MNKKSLIILIALITLIQGILIAEPTGIPGDANEDGFTSMADCLIIAQYYVGIHPGPPTDDWDFTVDGVINIIDAHNLACCITGLCFNCPNTTTPIPGINYPPDALDPSTPGSVWIAPNMKSLASGTEFSIQLHLNSGNQNLAAYHIAIIYDPLIIDFTSIAAGVDGFIVNYNNKNPGTIEIAGLDVAGKGPGTDFQIVVVTYTALQTGTTDLDIDIWDLIDSSNQMIGNPATYSSAVYVDLPVPTPVPEPVCTYVCGDVNCDDNSNIIDALMTAQYYVGCCPINDLWAADVTCDGKINIIDALIIAQSYVGMEVNLTCCIIRPWG